MRLFIAATMVAFSISSFAKCELPKGQYTDLEEVLNQFVLGNGNPNWGDWCYDSGYSASEMKACGDELNAWDEWLICADLIKE